MKDPIRGDKMAAPFPHEYPEADEASHMQLLEIVALKDLRSAS
jgi:hypothetical protein